jgi:hypothetical protein
MALSPEDLEQVGTYVKSHLPQWLPTNVIDLSERITRVEEELKSQRELMKEGFAHMDNRFESIQHNMDTRFESVQHNMDRRFTATQWFMGTGFAALILLVSLLEYLS